MNRLQGLREAPPRRRAWQAIAAALALTAAAAQADVDERTLRLTPARVGYVEGDVSFWRPGAGDWEAATVNIPLTPGDVLATRAGRFEVQVGPQSFLRAADQTQLRVKSQEPDFLQLELTQGSAVLDLRQLPAGHVVEIDTPQGTVTVNRDGFYRVDVGAASTRLTVRRAGAATLTPAGGQPIQVATSESATIDGGAAGQLDLVAAPAFDEWDRWNYARADSLLAAPRSYAVSGDVYGAADLDRYGGWRSVPTYGRVWVPYSVPVGWAPYTSGRWLWDPIYGYSWVDYAPWGWAPFHYGRWVYAGYWAWAPGPVVFAPVYAPALVSFFAPAVSVGIGFGFPFVGWTALSWGEPLVPWWGGVGFVGVPCWYGWGGPRVVNNIVINTGDTVNANQVNVYRNARVPGGLVGVPKEQFGAGDVQRVRLAKLTDGDVKPLRGATPASLGGAPVGVRGLPKGPLPDLSPARGAAREPGAAAFSRQAPSGDGSAGAAPLEPGLQGAPPDRSRSRTVEAAREPLPKQALPSIDARTTGAAAAPPPLRGMSKPQDGSLDAYRRLGGEAPAPSRAALAPSHPRGTERAPVAKAAPPPLRGMSKPAGGSADAYRRLRDEAPAPSRAALAPSHPRGTERAPVAKSAPPPLAPRAAAPTGGSNWNRVEQAAPSPPRARAMARAESAPMANFAPQPRALNMPSPSGGAGGVAMPSGGTIGGGGGMPAGGGGGRPSFSR